MGLYIKQNSSLVPLSTEYEVTPLGAVIAFYGYNNNTNWLLCDGRDTTGTDEELAVCYPLLYEYLGNTNVLPDLRECSLVGAGQNTTNNIASHDVYTAGQFKDDQMQQHQHYPNGLTGGSTIYKRRSGSNECEDSYRQYNTGNVVNARTGTTTHGKQIGVYYYIKATEKV